MLFDLLPLCLRQQTVGLVRDWLVVDCRDRRDARLRHLDREAVGDGELLQFLEELVAAPPDFSQHLALAARVIVAVKGAWNLPLSVAHKLEHVGSQRRAASNRQLDRVGLVGVVEVMDVDPVVRRWLARGELIDKVDDAGLAAGAGLAGDERVVAIGSDLQPETDGVYRAWLADRSPAGGDFGGCLEW